MDFLKKIPNNLRKKVWNYGSMELDTEGPPTLNPERAKIREQIIESNKEKLDEYKRRKDVKAFKNKAWYRNDPTNDVDESITENPGLFHNRFKRYNKLERNRKREQNRKNGVVYPGVERKKEGALSVHRPERLFYSGKKLNSIAKQSLLRNEKNRSLKQNCKKVINIPPKTSACWFDALLMVFFYSQNMRKLMLKKSEQWSLYDDGSELFKLKRRFFSTFRDILFAVYDYVPMDSEYAILQKFQEISSDNVLRLLHKIDPVAFPIFRRVSVYAYIQNLFNMLQINAGFFISEPDPNGGWDNLYVRPFFELNWKQNEILPASSEKYSGLVGQKLLIEMNQNYAKGLDVVIIDNLKSYSNSFAMQAFGIWNSTNILSNPKVRQFQADLQQNRIQIGNTSYVKDAVFLSGLNDDGRCLNRQIAGITCNNKSYIYNGWIPNEGNEFVKRGDAKQLARDALPCEIIQFDWKNKDIKYCLKRDECRLKSNISGDLCIDLRDGPRNYVFVNEDYASGGYIDNTSTQSSKFKEGERERGRERDMGRDNKNGIINPNRDINYLPNKVEGKGIEAKYILDDVKFDDSTLNCIRQVSNWSKLENKHKFSFDREFKGSDLLRDLPLFSPKMQLLLDNIKKMDEQDMKEHGHHFKHFIFSGVERGYGAPIICSALIASGFELVFDKSLKIKPYKSNQKDNRFAFVTKSDVYNKHYPIGLQKEILGKDLYNDRVNNIHGEKLRIILLDSKFKENLDLFEVRHVHIFEPQVSDADTKQVIGRATRYCGQMKLNFSPTKGWPLYVKIYDTRLPQMMADSMKSDTLHDLYKNNLNINLKDFAFAEDMEKHCIMGAVDYSLNYDLHTFNKLNNKTTDDGMRFFSSQKGGKSKSETRNKKEAQDMSKFTKVGEKLAQKQKDLRSKRKKELDVVNKLKNDIKMFEEPEFIVQKKLSSYTNESQFVNLRQYVDDNFKEFQWKNLVFQNDCDEYLKDPRLINFTPSQNFVRNYFHPSLNEIKGMLIYHTTGTGKTCTAISTATTHFEEKGYTILWITRTSITNQDFGGSMYDRICHMDIRRKIKSGETTEFAKSEATRKKQHLSKAWNIPPISYKTFTNAVSGKNEYFKVLMNMNDPDSKKDPLRKTLIIIDEAHKLYSEANDLIPQEIPDMKALYQGIMKSYAVSKKDSCRVMLLTATPITKNPLEIVKLINLLKPEKDALPTSIQSFEKEYLDSDWKFRPDGTKKFLNAIAGHISYLNQESYTSRFAQPVIEYVHADLSLSDKKAETDISQNGLMILIENKEFYEDEIQKNKHLIRDYENDIDVFRNMEGNTNVKSSIDDLSRKIKETRDKIKEFTLELKAITVTISKQAELIKSRKGIIDDSQESVLFDKCLFSKNKKR